MKSSIPAILWETWRLTRVEAVWKLAFGIVGGLAVLAACAAFAPADNAKWYENVRDSAAALAMILLVLPHVVSWLSLARLNGGRPGFPLYLHYTRPVRTAVIVGLPLTFLTAVSSAVYLVSALVLRAASDYEFPLLPVGAWIAAFTIVALGATWSTRNTVIQICVVAFAGMKMLGLAVHRLTAVEIQGSYDWPPRLWPTLFDFPLTDYAVIALIGLASFGVTVAGVTRQRRGDERAAMPSTPGGGLWGWLVNSFRFPCPVSSAPRAQIWFDLKSNGLPALTIGVALASVILLLSAVGGPIDTAFAEEIRARLSCSNKECFYARAWPVFIAPISLVIVLFLAGNAFGIRRKQGRTYISALETTQAYSTAQLAVLKLLVKSACILAALIALGVSVWISVSLLGDAVFIQIWSLPLSSQVLAAQNAVAALSGYEQLSLVVVAVVGVVLWVAAFAVFGALRTRYRRRVSIAAASLLLASLAFALLALAERAGAVPPFVVGAIFAAARWISLAAIVFTTVFVFWNGFAERVLTVRYACVALMLSAACGAAWLTMLHAIGVQSAAMSAASVDALLWPLLLPALISVLAPWSLNRIRHM